MLAFASNSLLCRMALGAGEIDAATFTSIRVLSGAITLALVVFSRRPVAQRGHRDWRAGVMLFAYMAFFSFAYLSLSAATGALLLFGAVQVTMFTAAVRAGERFSSWSWLGLVLALAGLVWLVLPGVSAPDLPGALLMAMAGVSWGVYSLLGRGSKDPVAATAYNFVFCVPLAILVSAWFLGDFQVTARAAMLAVASGALASGLGYVAWYAALKGLAANRAATVQLSVPVIAAIGGVVLLAEPVTIRLVIASLATLGGISLVLAQRPPT